MTAALRAGAAYFAIVFALGFLLGTIRVLVMIPALGATPAVLIELPILLFASWQICGWLLRRYAVPNSTSTRVVMGAFAFALLMLVELAMATLAFGQTVSAYLQGFHETHAWIGLLGQIGFAVIPAIRR